MDSLPNSIDSLQTRIDGAKAFLRENPHERIASAADIFKLHHTTLYNSISRDKKPPSGLKRGGHNKILDEHQTETIHQFIRSSLEHGVQPSREAVFSAIVSLKRAQDPERKDPTQRWFSTWWKNNNLDEITSKPPAVAQSTTPQEEAMEA